MHCKGSNFPTQVTSLPRLSPSMTFSQCVLRTNYFANASSCGKFPPQQHESEKCLAITGVNADPSIKFCTVLQLDLSLEPAAKLRLWFAAQTPSGRARQWPVSLALLGCGRRSQGELAAVGFFAPCPSAAQGKPGKHALGGI